MFEAIILIIATLGVAMVLLLCSRIMNVDKNKSLNNHRSKAEGFNDLLGYASVVSNGVVLCKSGALMASWLYRGDDSEGNTSTQKELVSARLNQAFAGMGAGWMIHVDAVRREASEYMKENESFFGDFVCEQIDAERRELFERIGTTFEGYFVITLTFLPPLLAQQKFVDLMFDDDAPKETAAAKSQALVSEFESKCTSFEASMSSVFQISRLCGQVVSDAAGYEVSQDDFLSWLHFCITGIAQPINLPKNGMYLDSVVGCQEFHGGVIPRVGRKFIRTVAIEGFPLESSPGMLESLSQIPCEYRWSNRFIFMDNHEAVAHLDKYRKKWKQKVRGFFDQVFQTNSGTVDQDAVDMVADAEAAIAEVNSGLVAQGYYTSVVVLMSESRAALDKSARLIEESINRLGFAGRIETINTMDAYMGSLPGHGVENVRRPLINTLNLADLLPSSSIWTGEEKAPCPFYSPDAPALMHCVTSGSTPFRLNLHVNDLGHTLMLGPTGAGKSTHLALLAAQFRRYQGMTVFSFDKGMSLFPLTASINAATSGATGAHFIVGGEHSRLAFAPLQFLETKTDRAWAAEWLDTILGLNGLTSTPLQRNEIENALNSMQQSGAKTLSEFSVTIQDEEIREVIKQYTVDASMGHLLDAESDGLALSDFTTFEIEELIGLGDKYALPVLLYLFRRIEKALKGQPSAIILDEAWIMLGNPVFREKIREWLKVLRKANCIVVLATQSLSDAANSGILDVIVESTATKILLPNPFARDKDATELYSRIGLNEQQIEIIARGVQKRDYYYMSADGRREYQLALGEYALAFVGVSDKEEIAFIQQLIARYEHQWVGHWLAHKGIQPAPPGQTNKNTYTNHATGTEIA